MSEELNRLVPDAGPSLVRFLLPSDGGVEPPIRSEIFGPERFAQHGRSLGETHRSVRTRGRSPFFPRLEANIALLREVQDFIGSQARTGYQISPAAEWLLDNFHLIEAQLDEIREGLPRRYFRDLPVLVNEPLAGLPRIYSVAWAFVAHTDGAFDEDLLTRFLGAYQESCELTLGELWALPTTLRVVLVENLRRLAERLASAKAAREVANLVGDRIEQYDGSRLDPLLALLNRRGVGRTFLVQLTQRLQDTQSAGVSQYVEWRTRVLPDLAAAQIQQPVEQAADNLSVSNAIGSLRLIGNADWADIVDRVSPSMRMLSRLPAFVAERVDTRDQTLHAIERLAHDSGRSESAVTQVLIGLIESAAGNAAVPSYWLHSDGRPELMRRLGIDETARRFWQNAARRLALPAYLATLVVGTGGMVAWLLSRHVLVDRSLPVGLLAIAAVLMALPVSEAVVAVINRLISESVRPRRLQRLALQNGIPSEHRVLVVIPGMLSEPGDGAALAHRLQLHYLANPERHAQFALLTDWPDAPVASTEDDALRLDAVVREVEQLNARHPGASGEAPRFIVLHRPRTHSESEQAWIGRERKRGKLEQLIALLAGAADVPAFLDLGESSRVAPGARYVVTLDGDTQLPPGRLRELVGVAAHPQNHPVVDPATRRVVAGHAILQPRVATPLPASNAVTLYHWLFGGQPGIDPYSVATSEVYQDVFDEGTFTGKGLLVVDAVHAALGDRLPEGQVLSHDLLEGSLARCAAVTDITIVEEAPVHADVAASRVHRWTRGDWQLLPFLLRPGRYPMRAINRWKMVDNLRRSLVMPASLGLLVFALATGVVPPAIALMLVLAALTAGPMMGAIAAFAPSRDGIAKLHFYRQAAIDLWRAVCGGLWLLAELLQLAMNSLDAVGRALWRMTVSRRKLLEWTTAASAQASATTDLRLLIVRHRNATIVALALWIGIRFARTDAPELATLLCLMWAATPFWTWWVSRTRPAGADVSLPHGDRVYLEGTARDTWRLFERCVGPDDRHLPPDNLQLTPQTLLARRTSPTNIGLYLLSACCARRFGWIGSVELAERLEATLDTLDTLPRHRGHFLNWYDTQTGAALLPLYVSTVDSGNLSGHLLAIASACRDLAAAPLDAAAAGAALRASYARLRPLRSTAPAELERTALQAVLALSELPEDLSEVDALTTAAAAQLATLMPDDAAALVPDPANQFVWRAADHLATLASGCRDAAAAAAGTAQAVSERLRALALRCERLAWEPDYGFVYHAKRHLFHIGYRVAEQQLDASYYDLLASESRLTSLLAIAKGDVPVAHWAALGRPFYAAGAYAGLRSWSGSMFEYLMPTLVLDEPDGSVLREACQAAVVEQMAYGREQGVPWGISESAYNAVDQGLSYQYAPQGVPRLALRRTPPDELVISPYSTALATQLAPHAAVANLARIESIAPRGRYGFVEALDFSPGRQTATSGMVKIDTFMAHHQGMSIVAIANVLLDGAPRRWGMADPRIEAVSSLLHERAPRELPVLRGPMPGPSLEGRQRRAPGFVRELLPGVNALPPTHLLGNGRYSVALRANGAGWSRWNEFGISRSRDDGLRDALGQFFYLRWDRQPQAVSLTQHPAPDPAAHYQAVFQADRVVFDATWPEIEARTTVWVSPEDDIEFRQVELRNRGERQLDLELMSAFEITLAVPGADESHPAFSNLFLRSAWRPAAQALLFERKPRLPTEAVLHAAHFLAERDPAVVELRVQTDRLGWSGRNRDPGQPLAFFPPLPAESVAGDSADTTRQVALDTGLDPVCALLLRVRLGAQSRVRLTFCTAVGDQSATLDALIDKHRQRGPVARASLMSATLSGLRLRELRITPEGFGAIQTLTSAVVMSLTRSRVSDAPPPELDQVEVCDRRLLWRFGISGDRPIVLVSSGTPQGMGLIRSLVQALRIWGWSRVACDVVVLNAEPASYLMPVDRELTGLREQVEAENGGPGHGSAGLHVLKADDVSADELSTLRTLARLHLNADGRPLAHHMQEWAEQHDAVLEDRQSISTTALRTAPSTGSEPRESQGRFSPQGHEFRFEAGVHERPPRAWVNVLANPDFGTQVSEAGGGYSWALNSRLNMLTPWSNDAIADPPGEWFVLQDLKTREAWTATASAWGDRTTTYRIAHGQGYTTIAHRRGDLDVNTTICVDERTAVKQVRIRLVNRGHRTLRLRAVGVVEWVMGANRVDRGSTDTAAFTQPIETPAGRRRLNGLSCTQRDRSAGFGGGSAFLAVATDLAEAADWTCDRREVFDARGRIAMPDEFGQRSGFGLDPCAALSLPISVLGGESAECVFLLGYGASPAEARRVAAQAASVAPQVRLERARTAWDRLLGACTVRTPDPLFDAMVNRWLLYQAVGCRMWAKAGFYQAGGAFGFRDQLQDAMSLAWSAPELLRRQIVLNASRQFPEGDVQHWWHAPTGAGVRTHFSDDLLWLPHACAHYLRCTGDLALLDEQVAFIEGNPIPAGAEDAYYAPTTSQTLATVFEHGARAIDRSLKVGAHGLPLMGVGDWNDGMNRVGAEGRGESVWLAWFLCRLIEDYAPIARQRGETARARRWEEAARKWREALQTEAWDGEWYRRAFFDDGTPLGSHQNAECRIDLIAQAWSVISGAAAPEFQRRAMAALEHHLIDPGAGLVKLLTPPLQTQQPTAGYIQAYPPGVRENGGQYSHAGVWAMIAQSMSGDADAAYRYFTYLSPAHRASDPVHGSRYRIEPYVMAGDVYSEPPYTGRGGWSWYTGSAAWMHRAAVEHFFGLDQQGDELRFDPCLPSHWPEAEITLQRGAKRLRLRMRRADGGVAVAGEKQLARGEVLRWSELEGEESRCLQLDDITGRPVPAIAVTESP